MTGEDGQTSAFFGLTPHAYALALAFVSDSDSLPLPVRVAWASFLRRFETCPHTLSRAALEAHRTGHLRGGRLTAKGQRDALEAFTGAGLPPRSIDGPHSGAASTNICGRAGGEA